MDSLELFSAEVMPQLKQDQAARDARKQAELAPYIAAALARKQWMAPLAPDAVPAIPAYGRSVVASDEVIQKDKFKRGPAAGFEVPTVDLAEKAEAAGND